MNRIGLVRKLFAVLALCLTLAMTARAQAGRTVVVLNATGPLTPAMLNYLQRGIDTAASQNAEAVIVQLDTPGGQIDLMDQIVNVFLESPVPVVVYVSPRGAIAGSAGAIIALAAHANAMAPQTAIGASSPVGSQGEDIGETMDAKLKSIYRAQVRNLAARRSPAAVSLAESMIEEAKAATADEAKAVGLTDFIAADLPDLLRQLDGLTVTVGGVTSAKSVTLRTADAQATDLGMSILEWLYDLLSNPNLVFILLSLGTMLILFEFSSPGGWVAGFTGAVLLILAFFGMGVLTVNWFGLVFVALAFVLFVLDINTPTHGALTLAATGSLIVGALVLFNSPESQPFFRVSVPLVVITSVALGALFFGLLAYALKSRSLAPVMSQQTLVGRTGEVRQALTPAGTVFLGGELWSAESAGGPIESGQPVEVVAVDGLTLRVRAIKP